MKRFATFLLLIGVVIGIAVQPAQALTPAMATMSMAQMSQAAMATMPDCTEAMSRDATPKPCKCGMAGCVAMMAAGAPFMLGDSSSAFSAPLASERQNGLAVVATLRGRSTPPEPEPPSILI
ncbi:hypothetical protein M9980_01045 [Sphingomonas donggukensis]|uniref:CopL family metal-binding regulatory protein n=1 Tax=Sphingomonas donggukensis TaxID=2949093 RepID=A0ABY4TTY1_9SPHN|nr:hypothetical protein [Sphingomonas donggukensis]URW75851.1 hypothetical protein M9980_01045 [Sphingomonas donggukensis]